MAKTMKAAVVREFGRPLTIEEVAIPTPGPGEVLVKIMATGGTVCVVGLPPGDFATPIFDVVLKRITLRGSIVGTRKDLAEAVEFAAQGKVHAHIHKAKLEDINRVFGDLKAGTVDGRIVLDLA